MQLPLTVVILVKNEAGNIAECLKTVSFAGEVIIVNNSSTDSTINIAKRTLPTVTIVEDNTQSFSSLRNRGLKLAYNTWVLFIDADERIDAELKKEIREIVNANNSTVYAIPRIDFLWGKKLLWGELYHARTYGFVRLVKKGGGSWEGEVHEQFKTILPVGKLKNALWHYPHQTIGEFITHINWYSTLRSQELFLQKIKEPLWWLWVLPLVKFLTSYILLLGFLDCRQGFLYSFFMSFHSFLVRSKLLQLHKKLPGA